MLVQLRSLAKTSWWPVAQPHQLANHGESKLFLRTALAWSGSVTPQVLPRVAFAAIYATTTLALWHIFPEMTLPMTPFEYSGAILGLLLVIRLNAGIDRWWEARKLWGNIVNQSRNLAIIGSQYSPAAEVERIKFLRWVAVFPHVMRYSLRRENSLPDVSRLLGAEEASRIASAQHMPTYVGARLAKQLSELRAAGLDQFAFQRAERERALLIDAIGACERILNTPIPLVLAIKIRRFITIFLIFLPLALFERLGILTPLITALASYPLFSLDEIGAELQNPFSPRNLSHLPLDTICRNIEGNVLSLRSESRLHSALGNG